MRYTLDRPRRRDSIAGPDFDGGAACPCGVAVLPGDRIRQQAIYEGGRLDAIEVGHAACVPDFDNAEPPDGTST